MTTQKLSPERRSGFFINGRRDTISTQSFFSKISRSQFFEEARVIYGYTNCYNKSDTENSRKMNEKSVLEPTKVCQSEIDVVGTSLAWDIIIQRLDFQTQMKISQQNKHLEEVVKMNAESQIKKFQRHIRENKYM